MKGGNKNSGRRSILAMRPDVKTITRDLALGNATIIEIAKRTGVSTSSVMRFKEKFVTEEVIREHVAQERIQNIEKDTAIINEDRMDVARTYDSLAVRVERLITKAEENGDDAFALAAMDGLRKVLRDIAMMQGKLAQNLTVNVSLSESKEWVTMRAILNAVCDEVPEAREPLLRHMRHHVLSVTKEDGFAL